MSSIAVIVPAYNEGRHIGTTIQKARQFLGGFQTEFIVVDNGSDDDTVKVAGEAGARVMVDSSTSVGGLRNIGVSNSSGDILLFLDADIHLTVEWAQRLPAVLASIRQTPTLVTGSTVGVPEDASWIERHWFLPISLRSKEYVNSGHLLISRQFFNQIGGFDQRLETGEDYDLCSRAVKRGGCVKLDAELRVEHLGFPKSIRSFIARESWHGIGDYQSSSILRSNVVKATVLYALLHLIFLSTVANGSPSMAGGIVAALLVLCSGTAYRIARPRSLTQWASGTSIAYFYLFGRLLAAFRALAPRSERRHKRSPEVDLGRGDSVVA